MPTTTAITWYAPTAVQTLLSAGLDDLVTNGLALSSAYNNASALDLVADFELVICYASGPPAAGTKVAELYLLASVDATNYPEGSSSVTPQQGLLIGSFESRASSTSVVERLTLSGMPIPPLNFKVLLKNTSAVTLKSSSVTKTLKMQPYQMKGVA